MNELVCIIVWKWWVLILAVLIAIILGIIILWLLLNKQSDEICCATIEQARKCRNSKCKLRKQVFDKMRLI
jgi:NO-binding membrane sensor protein with MHYT domain